MQEVIIATKNPGKAKEFAALFSSRGMSVKTLLDFPEIPDIEESGHTFEENALLKAESVSHTLQKIVISDDSGLIVDALGGRPGIYSARYAGEEKNDQQNIDKVLNELADVPDEERTARFYCALAVAVPGRESVTVAGTCEGSILKARQGTNGFGYDPIFFIPEQGCSMAELLPSVKNQISHRANAIKVLDGMLDAILEGVKTR